MAYISQITLPSGTTYDLKDTWARTQIEAITGGSAVVFKGVSSTPLTDGGNQNPTVDGTPVTTKSTGELYFYEQEEFIYGDDSKWHSLGSQLQNLGALAYKDSASGSYTPSGTVSQPTFTGGSSTVTITATTVDGKKATCKVTVEDPVSAFVRRLYKYCFNRDPDKGGFNYWAGDLKSKKITAAEAVKGFFDSTEMKNLNLKPAETIERCYLVMMDRKSDAGGKKYWEGIFKSKGKLEVLKGFVDSNEFTKICKDFNIVKGSIK